MARTASGRQTNWVNVKIDDDTFRRVQDVQFDFGGEALHASADGDFFPTLGTAISANPSATVNSESPADVAEIEIGATGTFTATHLDSEDREADNQGSLIYTMIRAFVINHQTAGPHQQVGTLNTTIGSSSADGTTSPLSVSIGGAGGGSGT